MSRQLYDKCKKIGISTLQVQSILSKSGFEVPQRTLQSWFDQDFSNCKHPKVIMAVTTIIKNHDKTIQKLTEIFEDHGK